MHGLWKATYWFFAVALLVLMAAGLLGTGCQRMAKAEKNWKAGWNGLDRTISVYTENGDLFARWNAKTYIETRHASVIAFLDSAGKEVKLSGGIIVVQEK